MMKARCYSGIAVLRETAPGAETKSLCRKYKTLEPTLAPRSNFNRLSLSRYVHSGIRKSDYSDTGTLNSVTRQPFHATLVVLRRPRRQAIALDERLRDVHRGCRVHHQNATEAFPPNSSRQRACRAW